QRPSASIIKGVDIPSLSSGAGTPPWHARPPPRRLPRLGSIRGVRRRRGRGDLLDSSVPPVSNRSTHPGGGTRAPRPVPFLPIVQPGLTGSGRTTQRQRGAIVTSNTPLRGALIGCGFVSRFHLEAWARVPGVEIVALCEPDPARLDAAAARAPGARPYGDAERMFEEA